MLDVIRNFCLETYIVKWIQMETAPSRPTYLLYNKVTTKERSSSLPSNCWRNLCLLPTLSSASHIPISRPELGKESWNLVTSCGSIHLFLKGFQIKLLKEKRQYRWRLHLVYLLLIKISVCHPINCWPLEGCNDNSFSAENICFSKFAPSVLISYWQAKAQAMSDLTFMPTLPSTRSQLNIGIRGSQLGWISIYLFIT